MLLRIEPASVKRPNSTVNFKKGLPGKPVSTDDVLCEKLPVCKIRQRKPFKVASIKNIKIKP